MRLEGDHLILRPFAPTEVDAWWQGIRRERSAFPAGVPTRRQLRRRVERSGRLEDGRLDLAMEVDGRLIGVIQTYRPPTRPLPLRAFELGILIFERADRRRGLGTEAVALLAGWLLEECGAERVQAATPEGNATMRRVLEKLGFVSEGIVGDFDVAHVLYVLTEDRWPAPGGSGSPAAGR